jgi:hypothetical protein
MPPVVAAAGIAAAATVGGAVLGNKAQKKASKSAAAAQSEATQAELEAQKLNAGLYRDVYNSNLNVLSPYNELGYSAASARNALLGLGAGPAYKAPAPLGSGATGAATDASGAGTPALAQQFNTIPIEGATENALNFITGELGPNRRGKLAQFQGDPQAKLDYAVSLAHSGERGRYQNFIAQNPLTRQEAIPQAAPTPADPATPATPAATPQQDYGNAFQNYLDSTGYQFQLGEGLKGLSFAKRLGSLDSGDTIKSAITYNQNMGKSYFNDYLGQLGQQQGLGLGAASAIAGQGSQYAANMANSNNASGNALANGAISRGNMALANGANSANMWGNIASGIGTAVGSIWRPSSYSIPSAGGGLHPYGGQLGAIY